MSSRRRRRSSSDRRSISRRRSASSPFRKKSARGLLNNAGQGFLSFGADLRVREEYSLECVKLFGAGLASRPFPELIAPADTEQMTFLRNLLSKLFQETEPAKRGLYVPVAHR